MTENQSETFAASIEFIKLAKNVYANEVTNALINWSQIVKAAEQDVWKDVEEERKNKDFTPSMDGLSSIIDIISPCENDEKEMVIKNNAVQDLYVNLKKEIKNYRVFGVGKTNSEKLITVAKMAGRVVGGVTAALIDTVGITVYAAGLATKLVPIAGFVIDRLPGLSTGVKGGGRKNILQILGESINKGARLVSEKTQPSIMASLLANMPVSAKDALNRAVQPTMEDLNNTAYNLYHKNSKNVQSRY